jgi:diadenosine tetraphosphate (Ap4A) HIT family hydrolase
MIQKPYVYPQNANSAEYKEKLDYLDLLGVNPFAEEYLFDARFGEKELVLKTAHWTVFKNQHKYNNNVEHQIMFVSKQEVATLWDLPPQAFNGLRKVMKKVSTMLNISGGGFVSRFGVPEKSGATVKHLHLQLLVPKDGHTVAARFGPRQE